MEITIKAARVNAGLTQAQSAKALKISKNTQVNYENYKTSPDMDMAQRMAELYGVPVNSIKWSI